MAFALFKLPTTNRRMAHVRLEQRSILYRHVNVTRSAGKLRVPGNPDTAIKRDGVAILPIRKNGKYKHHYALSNFT